MVATKKHGTIDQFQDVGLPAGLAKSLKNAQ
jgi:hypothetical protein